MNDRSWSEIPRPVQTQTYPARLNHLDAARSLYPRAHTNKQQVQESCNWRQTQTDRPRSLRLKYSLGKHFFIQAARILKINYSTAKSIFQNIKSKTHRKLKRKSYVPSGSEEESQTLKLEHDINTFWEDLISLNFIVDVE